MSRPCALAALAALLLTPALASALEPEEAGQINAEIAEKETAIRAEYGGGNIKKMSREERKEMQEKLNSARGEVLEKHGTTEKDFSRGQLKLGREGLKEAEQSQKEHTAKLEEAKKAGESKKPDDKGGVKVEQGINDDEPRVVDHGGVKVQRGAGKAGIEIPVPSGGNDSAPAE